jgi:hypothetical protein
MRMHTDTAKEQTGRSFTLLPVPLRGTTPLLAHAMVLHKHLDPELCVSLIRDAERCSEFRGGWRTKRHNSYPSTDLDMFNDFPAYVSVHLLKQLLHVQATVKQFYKIPAALHMCIKDLFIARYSCDAQAGLNTHLDGTTFSFVINLSSPEDYGGGGTEFPDISPNIANSPESQLSRQVVRLDQGEIIIFPGGLVPHGACSVSHGIRYILAGFVEFTHPQRGLDVHLQHKATMIASETAQLAEQLNQLSIAYSCSDFGGQEARKKPVVIHRQVYDKYLASIHALSDQWSTLEEI